MASESALELQKAIIARLNATAEVTALFGGPVPIFDFIPENQPMPFVAFGDHRSDEYDVTPTESSEGYGENHRIALHVWSDYEGKEECIKITGAMRRALRDQPLPLTDHNCAIIRCDSADHGQDADGQAFHGVLILRAITEEI
ncbi:MAG: DUF3168 domain-containing protein [Ahrensia sp.]|nr:DUF3168 domain-containing protein [Ahrensia sp.]